MVQAYFNEIATLLSASAWVKSVRLIRYDLLDIEEERILIYRIRVGLFDGGLLEISERLVSSLIGGTITITMYRLHWQDRNGGLIKRWDNATSPSSTGNASSPCSYRYRGSYHAERLCFRQRDNWFD